VDPVTGEGTVNLALLQKGYALGTASDLVPSSLRGLYTAKVDMLTQSQQLVLKYAAIIGKYAYQGILFLKYFRIFSLGILLDILPVLGTDLVLETEQHLSMSAKLTNSVMQLRGMSEV
jgi:hypothetical protein